MNALRAEEGPRRFGLIAVLLVALGLAALWVVRVPFFESPDENAHADYAFTLFTYRAPLPLAGRRQATNVHPLVAYLESASAFGKMHYNPDGRAPAGYGSAAFLRAVDAGAPVVPRDFLEHNGGRVPYVARSYASFYYALTAGAIWLGALLSGGSPTAELFAARGFNLVLLLCSLSLAYATFRELQLSYGKALALVATIGFFPLTSWVSAYVQPDNLSFLAVTLALYVALRFRREPGDARSAAWLGLALGLLAFTKAQYFVVVALPVLAAAALALTGRRRSWAAWAVRVALLIGPAAVAVASLRGSAVGADKQLAGVAFNHPGQLAEAARLGLIPLVETAAGLLWRGFFATFFSGPAFDGYWGGFSWDDTRIGFGSEEVTRLVYTLLGGFSLLLALLVAIRLGFGVWPRRDRGDAHRIAPGTTGAARAYRSVEEQIGVFRRDIDAAAGGGLCSVYWRGARAPAAASRHSALRDRSCE